MFLDFPILWLDLETTGFESGKHSIIELACFLSDGFSRELGPSKERFEYDTLIRYNTPRGLSWDAEAVRLHMSSGLYQEWSAQEKHKTTPLEVVDYTVSRKVLQLCTHEGRLFKPVLGGSSPHFDRNFIERHMPELNSVLFYRNFDVSTLISMYKLVSGQEFQKETSKHRAKDDIEASFGSFVRLR